MAKMYKLGQAAYIQARCWDSSDVPVTLEPRGDRMRVTWAAPRPGLAALQVSRARGDVRCVFVGLLWV